MTKEEYYFPCSTCHHTECVFTGTEDSHIKCKDYTPQEPFINKPCVSSQVCEHDKQKVLDKMRAEIESIEHFCTDNGNDFWLRTPDEIKKDVLAILDKYKSEIEPQESEDKNEF